MKAEEVENIVEYIEGWFYLKIYVMTKIYCKLMLYCRGGWLHTGGLFKPICCHQFSDFIPIVLTHYIRLNFKPLIATLQFLLHVLPPSWRQCATLPVY